MYGVKNLLPKGVLCDDNYTILKKRSEEYRRGLGYFVGHIQQMNKIYIDYYEYFEANIAQACTEMQTADDSFPTLYTEAVGLFRCLNGELRKFIERAMQNQKNLIEVNNLFMTDYNLLVQTFQERARDYFIFEQNVIQTCKKYFGEYKIMLGKIQSYKVSFMDVKLIYNSQEKVKRYLDCLQSYSKLEELCRVIFGKVDELNKSKVLLVQSYQILQKQLENFTTSFASRYIDGLKKFYECLFDLERGKLQLFVDKLIGIDKLPFAPIFISKANAKNQDLIRLEVIQAECKMLPSFIVYRQHLKQEGVCLFRRCILAYLQEVIQRTENRKKANRNMMEYLQSYIKNLDKQLMQGYKEVFQSFEKMRRKIGETFGSRWISFYKIIAAIFENSIQNTGRLSLRLEPKLKAFEIYLSNETKLLEEFIKELRKYTEKTIPKKILKKYGLQKSAKEDKNLLEEQKATTAADVAEASEFITNLIFKCNEIYEKNSEKTRQTFMGILVDMKQSMGEYFTFLNQISETYYTEQEYAKSLQIFQDEITKSVSQGMQFFNEIELAVIVKENQKITFDSEFNKIEGFKKIKKPKELDQGKQMQTLSVNMSAIRPTDIKGRVTEQPQQFKDTKNDSIDNVSNIINKEIFMGDLNSKHADFLLKKIILETNEKYVKSYSCSLSDTIILAGRLFITSNRLFFYSRFNPKTIFFGETFIEIPKKDLIKIEKRAMSFLSDRALSITTVHGELTFRSFFSRDATYQIIKRTFQVNTEEIFFEEEDNEGENSLLDKQVEFEDDMKEESSKVREEKLIKDIKQFKYECLVEDQFTFLGLTVVKFLKLFELDQQVNINRTSFPSFIYYFKDLCEHKEIDIQQWNPNPLEYMNVINLKEDTPQLCKRKISAVIPLPPSGIPFMPKSTLTVEEQTMFLINKDKVVIESVIKNFGVPYCQSYEVRIKRVIETSGQNKIKMTVYLYIDFNQNIMVKSTIQSKTSQSVKESMTKQGDQIKAYLRQLEKKMLKGNKKETPEDKIKEQADLIQELEADLKKSKEQNKFITAQTTQLTLKLKQRTIGLGVILLLAVLELIILIS